MDEAYLLKLRTNLEGHYSTMHDHMRECFEYYFGEFAIRAPKEGDLYKTPTAKNKIDVLTDHVLAPGRRVYVPEFGASQKAKEIAGKLQRFGQATLNMMERQSFNPVRMLVKQSAAYGMSCLKGPIFMENLWPHKPSLLGKSTKEKEELTKRYESERASTFPFYHRTVHPINLFLDPCMESPQFVFEKAKRKVLMVKALWPEMGKKLAGYADTSDITWWEYWDKDQYWYWVDDILVANKANWLGFLPYQIAYSGLGEESPDGGPEYRGIGLLYPALSSFRNEAEAKTAVLTFLKWASYSKPRIEETPMPGEIQLGKFPGDLSVIPKRLGYQLDPPPTLNPATWNIIKQIEDDIDAATASPVLEGDKPVGYSSGYQYALAVGQARVRQEGIVGSTEMMLGNYLTNVGRLIRDVVKTPMTISGRFSESKQNESVYPEDFEASPVFDVRFDGDTPEEIERRTDMGLRLLSANAISWETACKDFFNLDPAEERAKMLVEEVLHDENIKRAMAMEAIKHFGMDKYLEIMKDVRSMDKQERQTQQFAPKERKTQQTLGPIGLAKELNSDQEMAGYE